MRALCRFGWFLPAIAVPVCVAALGVGIQAAAFERPPRDAIVASDALRELLRYRVMRANVVVDQRPLRSICLDGWYHRAHHRRLVPGALVLLANGVRLYDVGNGVREIGRRGRVGPLDLARFLLAGCPRFLGARVGARLLGSRWIDTDSTRADGSLTLRLSFGQHSQPINLYVLRRTYEPIAMRLSGAPVTGWSDLTPGGDRRAIARVRRAFHLTVKGRNA